MGAFCWFIYLSHLQNCLFGVYVYLILNENPAFARGSSVNFITDILAYWNC
jgi:hypothetical protein